MPISPSSEEGAKAAAKLPLAPEAVRTGISIACPAFNEAEGIRATIKGWLDYFEGAPWVTAFEVVIADDGSTDATVETVDALISEGMPITLVRMGRNRGAGVALRAAIKATKLDWVLLIDSDGQFAIEDSALLWEALQRTGADMAVGSRRRKDDRLLLRLGSSASAFLSAQAVGRRDLDLNSALKLGRGEIVRALRLEARNLNYSADVTMKAVESGAEIVGVDVSHGSREFGESSASPARDGTARIIFTFYSLIRSFAIRRGILDVNE